MPTIETSVEVRVPARTAYNQWTQFEDFPKFMAHLERVEQVDDRHVRWSENEDGETRDWVMEISEQIPDKRIAWTTAAGPHQAGVVTFHRLDDERCKVMLQVDFEAPGSEAEQLARRTVARDLGDFKRFLEERGEATGAWRGELPSPDERG
jgi:uncharacterized membrane protein